MSPLDKGLRGFLTYEGATDSHPEGNDTVAPPGGVPETVGHVESAGTLEALGSDLGPDTGPMATPRIRAGALAPSDEATILASSPRTLPSTLAEGLAGSGAARPAQTRVSRLRGWTRRGTSNFRSSILRALGFLRAVKHVCRRDGSDSMKQTGL